MTPRSEGTVLVERRGRVSLVTLARPEARNALSVHLTRELVGALGAADRDERTGAIVLTGAGTAFCAGDDLKEAARTGPGAFDENIALLQQATRILLASRKPSVAAVNGPAIGGGLELPLACDLRLAAEHAVFACPEVAWGLVCTNGASVLLPAIVGHGRARDMLLTGRTYDAARALAAGLVGDVLPADELVDRALAFAADLAARPEAVRLTRDLLRDAGADLDAALEREAAAVAVARRTDAAQEGFDRFLARSGERA